MGTSNRSKLNRLLQAIPKSTVVTARRLRDLGVSPQLARKYVQSGWLSRLAPGAFVRAGERVGWRGGVYALQEQLGLTVHVAARTALALQGRAHFVPLGGRTQVILVSDVPEHLPAWFKSRAWDAQLHHRCLSLFEPLPWGTLTDLDCGAFSVALSVAERAVIEEMHLAGTNRDIEYAHQIMRGLSTLRPRIVQSLLETCTSVKAKRMFLWSAEAAGHGWLSRVHTPGVDLGSGKRQLYKGGVLDAKYQITVPPPEEPPGV